MDKKEKKVVPKPKKPREKPLHIDLPFEEALKLLATPVKKKAK